MSSVQFTMKSFARHLLRMMDLEERDGYMTVVVEEKPNLDCADSSGCSASTASSASGSTKWGRISPRSPALPEEEFEFVCSQIAELLDRVDQHDVEEIELLQDTLLYDEGGEGG